MRAGLLALAALALAGCDSSPISPDAGAATCEPACRDGFTCLRGECVSACNPPCGAGERCTGAGMCLPDDLDGGGAIGLGGSPITCAAPCGRCGSGRGTAARSVRV